MEAVFQAGVIDQKASHCPTMTSTTTVCVTGASGFIGSHLVKLLLEEGYQVRGTVRDATNEAKTAHLKALGNVELFSADLMVPGSFDEAIDGCDFVMHAASAVYLTADDPQKEIVDVAVMGTENVLDSVNRASSVKRVVLTSSVAAIFDTAKAADYVFSEDDWNDSANIEEEPYSLSKKLAEQRAHEIAEKADHWDLVAINPVFVTGPVMTKVHCRTSPSVVRSLMQGRFPGVPDLHFYLVDVRDVARAHLAAMNHENPEARYLCATKSMSMREMAKALRQEFPKSKTPRFPLPSALMYLAPIFDKRLTFSYLRKNLGRTRKLNNSRLRRDLVPDLIPSKESMLDSARSFVELGFI